MRASQRSAELHWLDGDAQEAQCRTNSNGDGRQLRPAAAALGRDRQAALMGAHVILLGAGADGLGDTQEPRATGARPSGGRRRRGRHGVRPREHFLRRARRALPQARRRRCPAALRDEPRRTARCRRPGGAVASEPAFFTGSDEGWHPPILARALFAPRWGLVRSLVWLLCLGFLLFYFRFISISA